MEGDKLYWFYVVTNLYCWKVNVNLTSLDLLFREKHRYFRCYILQNTLMINILHIHKPSTFCLLASKSHHVECNFCEVSRLIITNYVQQKRLYKLKGS